MTTFSPTAMIGRGWELVKKNPVLTIGGFLVANVVPAALAGWLGEMMDMRGLLELAANIFSYVANMGLIFIILQLLRGKSAAWADLFSQYTKIVNFFLASLLVGVIVMIGLILLIVPGIYLALRYQFFAAYIIDKNLGIMEALKASWQATEGKVWDLFLLALLSFGAIILGVLALGVGVFVAAPVVYGAQLSAYRELSGNK